MPDAVVLDAVAVSANTLSGFSDRTTLGSRIYDGLKLCPHSEMQCASSIAMSEISIFLRNLDIAPSTNLSGER